MHLSAGALVFFSHVLLVTAQTNASSIDFSGGSAGSSSLGVQGPWVVSVGSDNGALVFSPNSINAQAGDAVQFIFYGRNHSVAASSFDAPCVALPKPLSGGSNSFFTGFMPTSPQGNPVYTINVASTDPVWFFCSQGDHCQAGMVGVINPPASGPQNISAYAKAAKAVGGVSAGNGTRPASNATNPSRTSSSTVAQSTKANILTMNRVPTGLIGVALLFWVLL